MVEWLNSLILLCTCPVKILKQVPTIFNLLQFFEDLTLCLFDELDSARIFEVLILVRLLQTYK